jgi:hypothetical protein
MVSEAIVADMEGTDFAFYLVYLARKLLERMYKRSGLILKLFYLPREVSFFLLNSMETIVQYL